LRSLTLAAAAWIAFASPAIAQSGGGAPKSSIGEIEKLRQKMGAAAQRDSGAAATTAAPVLTDPIRLVPIRPVRVPGASFALGDTLESVVTRLNLSPDAGSAAAPGQRVFAGDVRYFSQDAHGTFTFTERWLSRVQIKTGPMTEAVRRYVVDEFLRQGYRHACGSFDAHRVDCSWTGRTLVEMKMDSTGVDVEVTLPEVSMQPAATATATVLPETLSITRAVSTGRPAPVPLSSVPPLYPDAARASLAQGVVDVLALVDETGFVIDARVAKGIPELNDAALKAVKNWRFEPYRDGDRPVRFWVTIPVRFASP